jgi:acyl carrier protein
MGQANIQDEFDIELKEGAMERLTNVQNLIL